MLKKNGNMNFAITAYDYLKITKVYLCSVNILPLIIMCDPKKYNSKNMKELFIKIPSGPEKDTLKEIIEKHDELIEQYQEDSVAYHKQVATFEKNFKLIK